MTRIAEKKGVVRIADVAPACAAVTEQAIHVKINVDKIPAYAHFIVEKYSVTTSLDIVNHYVSNDREKTAAYVLALNSINFGSGYFSIAKECGVHLEYDVIAQGLKRAFEQDNCATPEEWTRISVEDVSHMLCVPLGRHAQLDALLHNFSSHLRKTGEKIITEYGGKVSNLLSACDHSVVKLAETVGTWAHFRDVHPYKGCDVPILKRAQILGADMHLACGDTRDIENLTCFADNMVPHVLRCDGILEYTSDVPIASGSEKELEIRAAAIHAVELMKRALGGGVTSVNLDHMLWHRGYDPEIYEQKPHRTLSIWY